MKICVIIPACNEALNIAGLIKEVKKYIPDILVVDDGSSDDTFQVASAVGAHVIVSLGNHGKGASLKKGFKYALDNNFDAVITMDGDGQHLAQDLPAFIKFAEGPGVDMLLGNRMVKTGRMPFLRVATNKFMSWLISMISRQSIPDTQCGFRLIKKEVLQNLELKTSKYETESEMLIQAARLGFRISSVPIQSVYGPQKSRINPFIDTLRFIKLVLGG